MQIKEKIDIVIKDAKTYAEKIEINKKIEACGNQIKDKAKSAYAGTKSLVKNLVLNKDKEDKQTENDFIEDETTEKNKKEEKLKLNEKLKNAVDEYNVAYTSLNDYGTNLYLERKRSIDLIKLIENLINSIANRPKSFDTDINEVKMKRENFIDSCEFAKKELDIARGSAMGAGAGITAGATVASLAPSAAMWIATTFGTASTGTAISALSGAAATNAALAWLGGGALAAGGGGMATGSAFLALAGPIGWSIAGATLLSSVILFTSKKMKNDKLMKDEIEKVKINTELVYESTEKVKVIYEKTNLLREQLSEKYNKCISLFDKKFTDISEEQQLSLGTLVNNTKSLAVTLDKNI